MRVYGDAEQAEFTDTLDARAAPPAKLFEKKGFPPTPLQLSRREDWVYRVSSLDRGPLRQRLPQADLRALVRAASRVDVEDCMLDHSWVDGDKLIEACAAPLADLRRRLDSAVKALGVNGWLPQDEVGKLRIPIRIERIDERGPDAPALPPIVEGK
ncbi:MAG: hypothetical protein AB8H80_10710 [Planctomycetota bacterium]